MQAKQREVVASEHLRQPPPMDARIDGDGEMEVIPVLNPEQVARVELEKFMNDVLTIEIARSPDKNSAPCAEIGVNGRRIFIRRGVVTNSGCDDMGRQVPIRRMHVERLARAYSTIISQNLDPTLGDKINRLQRERALDYPFQVHEDPRPVGKQWLKEILAAE